MSGAVPILLYHSVDDGCAEAYRPYAVPVAAFDDHMSALDDLGCVALTISELVDLRRAGRAPPERAIAITFDDGLRDFAVGAMPILSRFGFRATLYVTTGFVGRSSLWLQGLGEGDRPMMGWDELREVADSGIEIGAHSVNHPQLDLLPRARAVAEIEGGKHALEDKLGRAVASFAYPHGYSKPATRAMARAAGFASACRVGNGVSAADEDLYALSRIVIPPSATGARLRDLANGRESPTAPSPDRLAAVGWRFVRGLGERARGWRA